MMDARVRVCLDFEGTRYYFLRMMEEHNRPEVVGADRVRASPLMSRSMAVAWCKRLRVGGWDCHVVTPSNTVLYEEEISQSVTPTTPTPSTAERTAHHVGSVLIIPGATKGFYIRFPGKAIESIYGDTPDLCYSRLANHPQFSELVTYAERYDEPAEHLVTPEEFQEALRKARYGDKRVRPGDRQ